MRSTEKPSKELCKDHTENDFKAKQMSKQTKTLRITKESGKYKSWNGNIKLNKQKINFPKETW